MGAAGPWTPIEVTDLGKRIDSLRGTVQPLCSSDSRQKCVDVQNHIQNHTVEVASKSQSLAKLDAKGAEMQAKMQPSMRGQHTTVTVEEGLAGRGVPRGGTTLGAATAGIGLAGALLARHENPNMSIAEFVARAFGVYEIAVATGDLPPPPPIH